MKILILFVPLLLLVGCSSPATPEDIKAAIKKCPDTKFYIHLELNSNCAGLGMACNRQGIKEPLTKHKLSRIVDNCQDEEKKRAKRYISEKIINEQLSAL